MVNTEKSLTKEEINSMIKDVVVHPNEIVIQSQKDLEFYGELLQKVKGKIKQLDELRRSITRPMDDAKKKIMELFKAPLSNLETIENTIKNEYARYTEENEYTPVDGISIRDGYTYVIEDESQIPREYFVLDEKAIANVVNALGEKANIPGIKVIRKAVVVSNSK